MNINLQSLKTFTIKGFVWKNIPTALASRAFLIILIFMLVNVIIGAIVLYVYVGSVQNNLTTADSMSEFNYQTYQRVLKQQETRTAEVKESAGNIPVNPFLP